MAADPVDPRAETLLDSLFDLAADQLSRYRDLRRVPRTEPVLATMLLDAARVTQVADAGLPTDHAVPVLLHGRRQDVRAARDLLTDDDRFEIAGVRLGLDGPDGAAAQLLLDSLDFTVPTWIALTAQAHWRDQVEVIVQDGVERLSLTLDEAAALTRPTVNEAARSGARRNGTGGGPYGWVNVLRAVGAALVGAGAPEVAHLALGPLSDS